MRSDGKGRPVYLFLVDGMLIDTGPQKHEKELIPFFKEHASQIKFVVLTHSHEDLSGNAAWIESNLQIPIFVHGKGLEICRQQSPYPIYRQDTWGMRESLILCHSIKK
ncbi:MBL fold metallo-hydrolase [Virgibacillus oceani]